MLYNRYVLSTYCDANYLMIQNTSMLFKVLRQSIVTNYENILLQSLDEMLLTSDRILTTAVEFILRFPYCAYKI